MEATESKKDTIHAMQCMSVVCAEVAHVRQMQLWCAKAGTWCPCAGSQQCSEQWHRDCAVDKTGSGTDGERKGFTDLVHLFGPKLRTHEQQFKKSVEKINRCKRTVKKLGLDSTR